MFMRLVAQTSGRALVGPSLSRDPVWIESGIDYVFDVFKAGNRIRQMPLLYGVLGIKLGLFPEVNNVYKRQRDAAKCIVPILEERSTGQKSDDKTAKPNDMLQYIMDSPIAGDWSFEKQSEIHLVTAFSSIQATGQVGVNALFDLCAHPEYVQPLRDEINTVMDEEDGVMSKKALAKMVKLDSFIKESQRLNPSQLSTFLTLHAFAAADVSERHLIGPSRLLGV